MRFKYLILIFFFFENNFAQNNFQDSILEKSKKQNFYLNEDSLISKVTLSSDTIFQNQKSVFGATISSMVIPGSGQIYNGKYWKTPVILGFFYYFGTIVIDQNNLYKQHRDLYIASISQNSPFGNLEEKRYRDFYRNQRDEFAWYLFVTYLINVVDAYVDSHLSNFEVSSDLNRNSINLNLKLRLK